MPFFPGILDTIEKVASGFAKVTCFIVPLASRVRRIPNTIGKVPPLGAKVTCLLGPMAALWVAGGRPGIFRGPAEAPFPRNASRRSRTDEIELFFNGVQDPIS